MPQLHLYVPEKVAQQIRQRAKARRMSVSRFLSELVERQMAAGWPDGYFERVVGGWQGKALKRPPQPGLEEREELR